MREILEFSTTLSQKTCQMNMELTVKKLTFFTRRAMMGSRWLGSNALLAYPYDLLGRSRVIGWRSRRRSETFVIVEDKVHQNPVTCDIKIHFSN